MKSQAEIHEAVGAALQKAGATEQETAALQKILTDEMESVIFVHGDPKAMFRANVDLRVRHHLEAYRKK